MQPVWKSKYAVVVMQRIPEAYQQKEKVILLRHINLSGKMDLTGTN